MNEAKKEIVREKREKVIERFKSLKKSNQLNKTNLVSLLNNYNTDQEIIICYLDYLKQTKDKEYIPELIYYYKIIPPLECKKHGINKISESQRFHDLIKTIKTKYDIINYVKSELNTVDKDILKFYEDATKNMNNEEKEKIKQDYIRWDSVYNTGIDFNCIDNEEYFYYTLSNSILRGQVGVSLRKEGIIEFSEVFNLLEENKKLYEKYFEYACLGLLNVSINKDNKDIVSYIIHTIMQEINEGIKFLDLKSILEILETNGAKYSVNNNQIKIKNGKYNYIIDNYNNYNLTKGYVEGLLFLNESGFKNTIEVNKNFNYYNNNNNYFDGLLSTVISNYVKTNLSKDSIEKIFCINEDSYSELFNEVTTDKILDYIKFIPYNNRFDTERTMKLYKKIIIDPHKELYNIQLENILYSDKLKISLRKFANIIRRKYDFEHEQHHLVTILLYYLYVNEKRRINSLTKEIDDEGITIVDEEENQNTKKDNVTIQAQKKRIREAGKCFKIFCYGKVQNNFNLQQLLFIANENNDQLNCREHKEQYENCSKLKLEDIIKDFPNDQPLSPLIKEIKEGFEHERKLIFENENKEKSYDDIMNNRIVAKMEDNLSSLKDFQNIEICIETHPYDNHIFDRRNKKK